MARKAADAIKSFLSGGGVVESGPNGGKGRTALFLAAFVAIAGIQTSAVAADTSVSPHDLALEAAAEYVATDFADHGVRVGIPDLGNMEEGVCYIMGAAPEATVETVFQFDGGSLRTEDVSDLAYHSYVVDRAIGRCLAPDVDNAGDVFAGLMALKRGDVTIVANMEALAFVQGRDSATQLLKEVRDLEGSGLDVAGMAPEQLHELAVGIAKGEAALVQAAKI